MIVERQLPYKKELMIVPTIKDALDIIGKLTYAEQESLKTMLLSPTVVKTLNIGEFVTKERFANGRVCPLCGCIHIVRNGIEKWYLKVCM